MDIPGGLPTLLLIKVYHANLKLHFATRDVELAGLAIDSFGNRLINKLALAALEPAVSVLPELQTLEPTDHCSNFCVY